MRATLSHSGPISFLNEGRFSVLVSFFRFKISILFAVGHTYLLISALRMWWLMKHYPLVDIFFHQLSACECKDIVRRDSLFGHS